MKGLRDFPGRSDGGLQEMAERVSGGRKLAALLCTLSERLYQLAGCDILIYSLDSPTAKSPRNYVWKQATPSEFSEYAGGVNPASLAKIPQQAVLVANVENEPRFPELIKMARDIGIHSFCWFPLNQTVQPIGTVMFGSKRVQAFGEDELPFLGNIARLVSLMIENAQAREAVEKDKENLAALGRISTHLLSNLRVEEVLPAISRSLRRVLQPDFTSLAIYDSEADCLRLRPLGAGLAIQTKEFDTRVPASQLPYGPTFLLGQARQYSQQDMLELDQEFAERMELAGIKSLAIVPLINRYGVAGTLNLGSKRKNAFASQDHGFLMQVANQIAVALEHAAPSPQNVSLTENLPEERISLEKEMKSSHNFEEIVGESPNLRQILAQVQTVAPSDSTVLILGETGTGKELIARAVHRMSNRSQGSFIKVNCAAIPTGLLESELFGHERGAFTSAVSQRIGRLEMADKGTLFLDEIGDIPLELQPKLLRVLQDHEFERLGGGRTIRINVRFVAATNCDLARSVAAREFRSDLFYRLSVFPVRLPPLRERTGDIPLLVRHFVQRFARQMNKKIDVIPAEAINTLVAWQWPGNVRELENFIERSVLLSSGASLNLPTGELRLENDNLESEFTLHRVQREHILRVLRETGGVIAGIHGAAARLGMKRTTLQSRMQRMGISRSDYEN
jgi:formate hydrogenlyase transcriptional activator